MLRMNVVRRAGRLLGAATVTGVLSLGILAAAPMAAQACPGSNAASAPANSISHVQREIRGGPHALDANGI